MTEIKFVSKIVSQVIIVKDISKFTIIKFWAFLHSVHNEGYHSLFATMLIRLVAFVALLAVAVQGQDFCKCVFFTTSSSSVVPSERQSRILLLTCDFCCLIFYVTGNICGQGNSIQDPNGSVDFMYQGSAVKNKYVFHEFSPDWF